MIPEFIGMVQPRLQSETHPSDKSVVLDKAYLRAFTQAHEAGGFDRVQGVQPAGSRDLAFRYGSQDAARLDPLPIISFLAGKTSHTGLGVTRSTTYYQPNHIVRSFTTLDHLSAGRGAWNVVTSMNESEGRIFGHAQHMDHDQRYDRADEFMEVAFRLWRSWDADALVLDKENGIFADPEMIRSVNHKGAFFEIEGPMNMPPGPTGRGRARASAHGAVPPSLCGDDVARAPRLGCAERPANRLTSRFMQPARRSGGAPARTHRAAGRRR